MRLLTLNLIQYHSTATTVQGNLSLNLWSKQNNFQFYAGVGNCHEVQFSSVGEFGFSSQRFWLKIVFFGTFYGYIYARLVAPAGRLKVSSTSLDFLFKRNDNECIFTFKKEAPLNDAVISRISFGWIEIFLDWGSKRYFMQCIPISGTSSYSMPFKYDFLYLHQILAS